MRGTYDVSALRADADLHGVVARGVRRRAAGGVRAVPPHRARPARWSRSGRRWPCTGRPSSTRATCRRSSPTRRPRGYVCVYPFVRSYEWYLLPDDERRALLAEHGQMARDYPDVRANTVAVVRARRLRVDPRLRGRRAAPDRGPDAAPARRRRPAGTCARRSRSTPAAAAGRRPRRRAALTGTRPRRAGRRAGRASVPRCGCGGSGLPSLAGVAALAACGTPSRPVAEPVAAPAPSVSSARPPPPRDRPARRRRSRPPARSSRPSAPPEARPQPKPAAVTGAPIPADARAVDTSHPDRVDRHRHRRPSCTSAAVVAGGRGRRHHHVRLRPGAGDDHDDRDREGRQRAPAHGPRRRREGDPQRRRRSAGSSTRTPATRRRAGPRRTARTRTARS